MRYLIFFCCLFCLACQSVRPIVFDKQSPRDTLSGSHFYRLTAAWKWRERDSLAVEQILHGNMPAFLQKFVPITSRYTDSAGNQYTAKMYVTPDYLAVGTDADWARIPLTPMAAQQLADSFHCFLPTRKIVDLIYAQAKVKLEPIPMYAFRDSSVTMWQHHLIIEGQRKGRKGLIAGIKKDVVIAGKILEDSRPNREAIYGWHLPNGKAIQPLYTGHINWWVDYSHGIRLVYQTIWVNGKPYDYRTVLQHPVWKKLLSDESRTDFYRY